MNYNIEHLQNINVSIYDFNFEIQIAIIFLDRYKSRVIRKKWRR